MNFKTGFIALALMGLASLVAVGCGGNACDDLADKFEECGYATTDGGDAEAECTEAAEKQAQCLLDSSEDICTLEGLGKAVQDCAAS